MVGCSGFGARRGNFNMGCVMVQETTLFLDAITGSVGFLMVGSK